MGFLRRITADGTVPVTFCRMLPYAGTPIEEGLAQEGRLRGRVENPDYDFLDPRIHSYFEALNRLVAHWTNGSDALLNQLNFAWHEYGVLRNLFPPLADLPSYERCLRTITRRSNEYLLTLVEDVANAFENDCWRVPSAVEVQAASQRFGAQLLAERNAFVLQNQETLLAYLGAASRAQGVAAASHLEA